MTNGDGPTTAARHADAPPVRLLTFASLYPNPEQPQRGVFVENRLRHLVASGGVEARVVAPVPWFPFTARRFGSYGAFARVPRRDERGGIAITHPRYPLIPKVGMTLAPKLMYLAMRPHVARLIRDGYDFDVIDAHYFYPDGVCATMLGRHFGKPVTITARGTDVNVIPDFAAPRRMILQAAGDAAAIIAVSEALRRRLIDLGVAPDKVVTLRNGVDLDGFRPLPQADARRALGIEDGGPVLVEVGNLLEAKGQHLAIEALVRLDDARLLLAGAGSYEASLRQRAAALGVADRVTFLGRLPHERLFEVYSAADVSLLPSANEGWPNVLLESMACGTPVVATDVGGMPEIVTTPAAGRLIAERSATALAEAVTALLADPPDRAATRAHAEAYGWDAVSDGQRRLFADVLKRQRGAGTPAPAIGPGT